MPIELAGRRVGIWRLTLSGPTDHPLRMVHPVLCVLRTLLVGLALLWLPGRAQALDLDFEGLAAFSDPSLQDLPGVQLSSALVIDEEALGMLVGFAVPGDVEPGSLASSGAQGIVNFDASVLTIGFDDAATSVSLHLVLLRGSSVSVGVFGDAGLLFQIDESPALGASGFPTIDLPIVGAGIRELRISAGDQPLSFFLDDLVAAPEPATAALLAFGFASLAAARRRDARRDVR